MKTHQKKTKGEKIKCSCGHTGEYHYLSMADISYGQVFCGKDNCTGRDRCDLKLVLTPSKQ